MKIKPPCPVSQEELVIKVEEIEPLLQAPPMDLKPWPEAMITLNDGRTMFIRSMQDSDVPQLLD